MIKELINALRAGEELKNAESWKNRQTTANAIVACATGLFTLLHVFGVDLHISDSDILGIATGFSCLLGIANGYLTPATSARVGLRPVDQGNTPTGLGGQGNDLTGA